MGQDPALHAWKFTPPQPHAFKWSTDEECLLWAEAGKRKAKKQLSLLGILVPGETPQMNKKASPETLAAAATQNDGNEEATVEAVPFNLE